MLLSEILKNSKLDYTSTNEIDYTKINVIDITRDTREVIEGSLFIAVIGLKVDGHDLINDAIENRNSNLEVLRERVKTLCAKYPLYN